MASSSTPTFTAEGMQLVGALCRSGLAIDSIAASRPLDFPVPDGTAIIEMSKAELAARTGYDFHRGIIATAPVPEMPSLQELLDAGATRFVAVPEIADPGNVGTVIRTALALGYHAVLTSGGTSPWNRKALRASAGATFHLPIIDSPDLLRELSEMDLPIIATTPHTPSIPLAEVASSIDLSEPHVIAFGSEGPGLSAAWLDAAAIRTHIPIASTVESLNLAASAAIVLHALRS